MENTMDDAPERAALPGDDELIDVTCADDTVRRFVTRRELRERAPPRAAAPVPTPAGLADLEARLRAVERWIEDEKNARMGEDL